MKYEFHIETIDGQCIAWRNLTLKQARDMYAWTDKHMPDNVKSYGWEEQK